jgi:hypothetical protein
VVSNLFITTVEGSLKRCYIVKKGGQMDAVHKIIDGYIHFKLAETSYVHYLDKASNSFALSELEHYIAIGEEDYGMKRFIQNNFVPIKDRKDPAQNNLIEIISYHFEFE